MVTIQKTQQQLRQRSKTIQSAEVETIKFDPNIKQSQTQLRKATPLSQARVKTMEVGRREAKKEVLQKISLEKKKQVRFEKQFASYLKTPSGKLQWVNENLSPEEISKGKDIYKGFSVALTKSIPVSEGGTGKFETGFTRVQVGDEVNTPYGKVIVPLSRKKLVRQYKFAKGDLEIQQTRLPTPTEKISQMSLPAGLRNLRPLEVELGISLPAMSFAEVQKPTVDLLKEVKRMSSETPPELLEGGPRQPSLTKGLLPTHVPSRRESISTIPTQRFAPDFKPTKISLSKVAGAISTGAATVVTKLARASGVPTITEDIKFKEKRFFEKGTGILDPKTGKLVLPEPADIPSSMSTGPEIIAKQSILGAKQKTIISPEIIGGVAGTATTIGLFTFPATGIPLLAGEVSEGVKTFRQKIPSISQVIKEQTPELSMSERLSYLKTEEGKIFRESVESYVNSLEVQRKAGLGRAVLGAAALVGPAAIVGGTRVLRAAKAPFKVQFIGDPKTEFIAKAVTMGDVTTGVATRVTITPSAVAEIPTYKIWYAKATSGKVKVPRDVFKFKSDIDVAIQPFVIADKTAISIAGTRKFGKGKTLTKLEQTLEIQKPTEVLDFSKLPPELRYISKKLPALADVKGIETFIGVGGTVKGVGLRAPKITKVGKDLIIDVPLRADRFSKTQRQFFLPTEPVPATFTKPISMVKQVGVLPGDTQVFAVQSASKTTKKITGIAAGKVTRDTGTVFIKQVADKGTTTNFISKSTITKQATKQTQLAARIQSLVSPKPIIPKKAPKVRIKQIPKSSIVAPIVARPAGAFAGQGLYERTEDVFNTPRLVGVTQTRLGSGQSILADLKYMVKERSKFDTLVRARTDIRGALIPRVKVETDMRSVLIPKLGTATKAAQAPRFRFAVREAIVPRLSVKTAQIQKPKTRFPGSPQSPRSRPTSSPRPPKRTPKLKISTDLVSKEFKKKGKRKDELVTPFVRRFGKFFGIGKPTTQKKALKRGKKRLRSTLAASLQLRRTGGEIIPFAKGTKEFRAAKAGPTTLVQRQRQRLGRISEVQEIIASRKLEARRFI